MPRILFGRVVRTVTATVALTVIAGGLASASASKHVYLSVNGTARSVKASAGTVGQLLAEEHILTSHRDLVLPGPGSTLLSGMTVTVRHARPLEITQDGQRHVYWTVAPTVGQALDVLGTRWSTMGRGTRMSASRSAPISRHGLALNVSTPKKVTLVVDGKKTSLTTTATDVRQLLAEEGVPAGTEDLLSAGVTTSLYQGLVVKLWHVKVKRLTTTERIGFRTVKQRTATLYKGRSKVTVRGRAGVRKTVYDVVTVGGMVKERKVVSRRVMRKPVHRVVKVGTRARQRYSGSGSGGGGLNWAALARCESGGNPGAVSANGLYMGLFQFSLGTWRSVGGRGRPNHASSGEQTHRAWLLYQRSGRSPWPHCGRYL